MKMSNILNEIPQNESFYDVKSFVEKFEEMGLNEITDSEELYYEIKKLDEYSREIIEYTYFGALIETFTKYTNIRRLILRCKNDE